MFIKVSIGAILLLVTLVLIAWKTSSVVLIQRTLKGKSESVWAIWNDPASIKKWWGPNGFSCPVAQNDLRVGGKYLPIPGERVKLPGSWPDAVTVSIEFEALADGNTQITITETGIPLIIKLFAKMGWEQQLSKMEKLLN